MMRIGGFIGLAVVAGLAACVSKPPSAQPPSTQLSGATAAPPAVDQAAAEPLDPFVVMIDAERWTVLLEHAVSGAIEAPAVDETDAFRADAALKQAAAQAIYLRNQVCGKGLLTGDACKLPAFPAWTKEPPTGATPLEEISRRSDWISEMIQPYVDAGCAAGKKATGEEMYCSVE